MVDLDHRRNKTREALNYLKSMKAENGTFKGTYLRYFFTVHYNGGSIPTTAAITENKTWMCMGNTFLKVDTAICDKMLRRGLLKNITMLCLKPCFPIDKDTLDAEVTRLREELKPKVSELHKMEG